VLSIINNNTSATPLATLRCLFRAHVKKLTGITRRARYYLYITAGRAPTPAPRGRHPPSQGSVHLAHMARHKRAHTPCRSPDAPQVSRSRSKFQYFLPRYYAPMGKFSSLSELFLDFVLRLPPHFPSRGFFANKSEIQAAWRRRLWRTRGARTRRWTWSG
jgi:hypothetical protein